MKHPFSVHLSRRTLYGIALILLSGVGYYLWSGDSSSTDSKQTSLIVQKVEKGTVSSGILTSGNIEAREILDLNVYTLEQRIDSVAVENGAHVDAGQTLYLFDEADVAVTLANSRLSKRQAELTLEEKQQGVTDPNTTVRTLKTEIADIEADIARNKEDQQSIYRTYLNADLEAKPTTERYSAQVTKVAPSIGGLYTGNTEGMYTVVVYASAEISGYSFQYSGLESGVSAVHPGVAVPLGTRGLTITFPTTGVSPRDAWVIPVPNIYASTYITNKETYVQAKDDLALKLTTDRATLANKQTALEQALRGDTTAHRDLSVESALLGIEQAQVDIAHGLDTREERRIVAPFAGSVEGVENVVVGATPTKDGNDSINLGYLISDEFVATFSLGASDIDKVHVGQAVLVSLSSVPGSLPLSAEVTEVSSLPDSSAVPQYAVRAKITESATSTTRLRDGMLADIEIVQEERTNVVRVPVSALTYREGKAYVQVLENPSEDMLAEIRARGVAHMGATTGAIEREVTLGIRGTYYAEVVTGLEEGMYIVVTSMTTGTADTSVVGDARTFGPGRPRETSGTNSETTSGGQSRD
jgi:HlyD family secretion protein